MTPFRLIGIALTSSALLLARGEDRLSLTGLSGCGLGTPLRLGGEISVETDRFFFKNLTAGYLAMLPAAHCRDAFEIVPGVQGFDGMYMGLRQLFQHDFIAPFVGISVLEHVLSERPYASVNPEVGVALAFRKRYELSAHLRYFLTSRGRRDDFLTVGLGLSRLF